MILYPGTYSRPEDCNVAVSKSVTITGFPGAPLPLMCSAVFSSHSLIILWRIENVVRLGMESSTVLECPKEQRTFTVAAGAGNFEVYNITFLGGGIEYLGDGDLTLTDISFSNSGVFRFFLVN